MSIGQYVTAVKAAIANPDVVFKTGLTSWWPTSGREITYQFRQGMMDRINQAIPAYKRGI
ncbi:MAG: hypothetical protein IMZ71_04815 [Chloroflexi bacterium]|nr:hypothetical protein [Chloroflexota bacterium]